MSEIKRCKWCNLKNTAYIKYHDEEWGVPNFDEQYLFEMLILESFQAGLSWECVLNKREHFRRAFDGFDIMTVSRYDAEKCEALACDPGIIRNRRKIQAAVVNARIFLEIQAEYGSFSAYLRHFSGSDVIFESDKTSSTLSDRISADLRRRGMKFVGTTIIYAYLQAIGIINSHEEGCFLYRKAAVTPSQP